MSRTFKRLVVDLSLDKSMLQDVLAKVVPTQIVYARTAL